MTFLQLLGGDGSDGARNISFFGGAIADDNDIVEAVTALVHRDHHLLLPAGSFLLVLIAYQREHQDGLRAGYGQMEPATAVRSSTHTGALNSDTYTRQGVTLGVQYSTPDNICLCLEGGNT